MGLAHSRRNTQYASALASCELGFDGSVEWEFCERFSSSESSAAAATSFLYVAAFALAGSRQTEP